MSEQTNSAPCPPESREELIQYVLDLCRDFGITELYLPARNSDTPEETVTVERTNAGESLDHLRHVEIGNCTRCKLHRGRKTIVFGEGNPNAQLMLIGEAPGADEDIQGRPFVGRAGQLLMQMIKAINFERDDVYIANVLKCRPPDNRPPEPDEISQCSPFLMKQIATIQPKIILALGTFSAQLLLNSRSSISILRNRVYEMPFGRVIATYHPSFLLRSPQKKPEAWEDLKLVRKTLQE
ncbi:MAG TPA: uracil-DNA glycosylase [Acidobacteriota bacterium]|nr:uracil-DNA glycosylase [Acidobacteriota bacterium]